MATALSVIGIALFWVWSLLGRRAYRAHTAGRLFEIRQAAAMQPFALLIGIDPIAAFQPSVAVTILTGVAAGLVYARYVALDPLRTGFWQHRRLRPIGTVACVAAGAVAAFYAPAPALAPLAFAALVFNRYLRLSVAITEQHLADLEAQRQKLLSLSATFPHSAVDKVSKAG